MFCLNGKSSSPFLIIHGGAGPLDPSSEATVLATRKLIAIAQTAAQQLSVKEANSRIEAVVSALTQLEDDPTFNAGVGSALQVDGSQRLTAAIMDGADQRFSGVISVSHVKNPSLIARHLQTKKSRVVTAPGHEMIARNLALPVQNLMTETRLQRWLSQRAVHSGDKAVIEEDCDTVGCIVMDHLQQLACGTSTGGRGSEIPGRVSDSGTVAGNYASPFAAISATGIGEQIVDDALAARLETRCRDGLDLVTASQRCFEEAKEKNREYGWIGLDCHGHWVAFTTTSMMTFAVVDIEGRVLASSLSIS
jgi:L-asparaginase